MPSRAHPVRRAPPPLPRFSALRATSLLAGLAVAICSGAGLKSAEPVRARHGLVVAEERVAAEVGCDVLRRGGNAMDAAVATALALAVTHPAAGNIGGGGFLVWRGADGTAAAYDFRETAPAAAHAAMFLTNGVYDYRRHHRSHTAVGIPGTVAGLHLAWQEQGRTAWRALVTPAARLARRGFVVSEELARSLRAILPEFAAYPATLAQFSRGGTPLEAGEILRQPDLAETLDRIALRGPAGFYGGRTADLIAEEMSRHGGWITRADLQSYRAVRREVVRGSYRGLEILSMPPPSSGGIVLIEMLNVLEGFDLRSHGAGSATNLHRIVETMRRAFADRARHLGDPDFNPGLPVDRLLSPAHAAALRASIRDNHASRSTPDRFDWSQEGPHTTHLSVVDGSGNAVALTYTIEESYGSRIVVPGAGFLLNNEMGDFNPQPGVTGTNGWIGTAPNLAAPGKRMLSSMTPTIVVKDGRPWLVLGSPGGRTIINTVLLTLLNVVDFNMNLQEAVDAPRLHHQWLPDEIVHEARGFSPDTLRMLQGWGHSLKAIDRQGFVAAIRCDPGRGALEGAVDRRAPDAAAVGW